MKAAEHAVRRRALLAGMGAGALLAAGPARSADGDVLTMRFAMKGPRPVTTLSVGGHGPYIVLIDSGDAVAFSLKPEIIDKLDLRQNGQGRIYGVSGTDTALSYLAHDVVIGQAMREPDVSILASSRPRDLDGILPFQVLTARPTDLDFEKGEIRLQLRGRVDRTAFRAVHADHPPSSGEYPHSAFVVVADIDGVPARLVVDTGAPGFAFLDAGFVRTHGLWNKYPKHLDTISGGVTGHPVGTRLVRTPTFSVGGIKFRDPVIEMMDPSRATLGDTDGLLGIEFLRRFTVGFDAAASTLWLQPNQSIRDPWTYDRSGLTWEWTKTGAVVKAIAAGSPAEAAGVQVGDKLVDLATEKAAYAWDAGLSGDPDTEIKFDVERGGARKPIKMVLKDWL